MMTVEGSWVIAGAARALEHLAPLVAARRQRGPVVEWVGDVTALLAAPAEHLPVNVAGVLVVGDRRRSAGRALPGLFLPLPGGRLVPVGWLPDVGPPLANYAQAAAAVLRRDGRDRTFAVLGQWEDRFLRVGLRAARWLDRHDAETYVHWTADRIARSDMINGLRVGPAVAAYFGHGRPRGWAGYHGVRTEHFERPWGEPVGALLALCCENASRHRIGLSFAERLVLSGVCGGMMAAVTKTRHEDNRRWGPELCEAFTEARPRTLADLVKAARVPERLKWRTVYRFIGDPLVPLAGAEEAAVRAKAVFAPAPDEPLPPWAPPEAPPAAAPVEVER